MAEDDPTDPVRTPAPAPSHGRPRRAGVRRRDRHGRGLRGPLVPAGVPLAGGGPDRFEALVVRAVTRLQRRAPAHLAPLGPVDVIVTELPPSGAVRSGQEESPAIPGVPLASATPPRPGRPARLVVHRRPIESRATGRAGLERLIRSVVAEELAALAGTSPDQLDPGYDPP